MKIKFMLTAIASVTSFSVPAFADGACTTIVDRVCDHHPYNNPSNPCDSWREIRTVVCPTGPICRQEQYCVHRPYDNPANACDQWASRTVCDNGGASVGEGLPDGTTAGNEIQ